MNIAITGEGIISAIGTNKEEVLQSLLAHKSGIKEMQFLQSVHHELPVGEVALSNEQMKKRLGIPEKQLMSRTELMGILAIRQALEDAGIDLSSVSASNKKIVLVSGTTVGGMDLTEQSFNPLYEQFQSQQETKVEELAFLNHHDGGNCTQKIADYFRNESATGQSGFDELTTISTACSSAANAIMLGAKLLETGEADIVVAGGSEALSRFHLNGFNSLMILDKKRCRPFDATRAGLNLGEGAAFVVLESESAARHQGKTLHAYLTGYGNACDAYHQTASSENGEGAFLAMKEALNMAHIEPEDIQYVNAHGTGTPNNDQSESESLKRLFGKKMPWISSTKSFTGHTTSASGSIEAIICLLAMQHHFIPANLGWEKQMENGIIPCTGIENVRLEYVLCNSFGFGGNDSSLIFSTHPTEEEAIQTEGEAIQTEGKPQQSEREPQQTASNIRILSTVEINSEEDLSDIRKYVKPLEARRMGKIMKSSLLSSLEALEKAGIATPDAIITGTTYGCLENSEKLLVQLKEEGEEMLKPTYFMQSTHNTIGSNIAIKTHCHGYNITYTQGEDSLDWAIRDAKMLLASGKAKTVLVGCHDESTPLLNQLRTQSGEKALPSIHSIAMVLSCGE